VSEVDRGHALTVGRGVITELVGQAALEVPGVLRVGRGGSALRRAVAGPGVSVRFEDERVHVRIWIVARPGQVIRPLTAQVGTAVAATVERLLGLQLAEVTVLVDGVGN
jgi:uncharacterized alkaline shock family protein YloU